MVLLHNEIKEVIVVEGYHDLAKLKAIYENIDVYITNGSEVSKKTLEELKVLNETRGLILFLDPDYQGERIRRILTDYIGPCKHAFLMKKNCINKTKTKVGIEHANKQKIIEGLAAVYTIKKTKKPKVKMSDLYHLGLVGNDHSKALRLSLGETLGIGLNNGKTLLNKINMFGISLTEIKAALRK